MPVVLEREGEQELGSSKKRRTASAKDPKLKAAVATKPKPKTVLLEGSGGNRDQGKRSFTSRPLLIGPWQTHAVPFLLLMLASVGLYTGDLHLGFFGVDDPQYVVNNPWIRGFSFANLSHILRSPYFANYSPVHLASYMTDYVVGGLNPFVYHLSSNLWAGLVAGLVYLVALALTARRIVAISAAVLFILHPAHVEAVAWISSRKDLIAAAFALPSLLAYLRYRNGGPSATRWYVASVLLFVFAVSGKLSVASFPAVFLLHDLFVERRNLRRSLLDKVPFVAAAGLIALVVTSAQPSMGHRPDTHVLTAALGESLWLLTGFGRYVIYRVPPAESTTMIQFVWGVMLLCIFAAPLLLRHRLPTAVVLGYWILFGYLPSQVLSFTHPVADRYLFFPSVGAVILIAWGAVVGGELLGRRRGLLVGVLVLGLIAVIWGRATLAYLGEWRDPRSVWYAASSKSSDPIVTQNLGSYYLEVANRLGTNPQRMPLTADQARTLASSVWAGDPQLSALLDEWGTGQSGGPVEKAFQAHLRTLAWDEFERTLNAKGNHVMPGVYYNRGLILLDRGDLQGARKELLEAISEASRESFAEVRSQITVYSQTQLGVIAVKSGDYPQALSWYRLAEQEQIRSGGNWMPDITEHRKRMEEIVASQRGN